MTFSKPLWRRLVLGAVTGTAAAVTLGGIPAASAAESYLSFSTDGTNFTSTLARPVFDQNLTLVPGTSTAGTIWVRNDGDDAAYLSAGAVATRMDPQLAGMLGVSGSAPSRNGKPVYLGPVGECAELYRGWEIPSGDAVRVALTAGLSPDAPNEARNRSAGFNVVFHLQAMDGTGTAPGACDALDTDAGTPVAPPEDENAGSSTGTDTGDAQPSRSNQPAAGRAPEAALAGFPATGIGPGQAVTSPEFNKILSPMDSGRPVQAVPAGFQSTVEPIIRSLSGTLLIVMSVAFFAAAGIRLRSRGQ